MKESDHTSCPDARAEERHKDCYGDSDGRGDSARGLRQKPAISALAMRSGDLGGPATQTDASTAIVTTTAIQSINDHR